MYHRTISGLALMAGLGLAALSLARTSDDVRPPARDLAVAPSNAAEPDLPEPAPVARPETDAAEVEE
jgi:hypothetical protein